MKVRDTKNTSLLLPKAYVVQEQKKKYLSWQVRCDLTYLGKITHEVDMLFNNFRDAFFNIRMEQRSKSIHITILVNRGAGTYSELGAQF